MKNTLIIFIGIFILYACPYSKAKEAMKLDYHDGPTTPKEKNYLVELESKGFSNILFAVPVIEDGPKTGNHYGLTLQLRRSIDSSNLDSIKKVRDEIANYLYTDIIADSALTAINSIFVNIEIAKGYYPKGEKPSLFKTFYKDSLAKMNGFKVIRTGKTTYKRIPYWEKVRTVYTK